MTRDRHRRPIQVLGSLPLVILVSGWAAPEAPSRTAPSVTDAVRIAARTHPAPGGVWERVQQPFWPQHTVVKLESVTDHRWYHRPTVAIDPVGKAHTLTSGAIRVSDERLLADFNAITEQEGVLLEDERRRGEYVAFFLAAHLLNEDFHCLRATLPKLEGAEHGQGVLPESICSAESFRLSEGTRGIWIDTVLVDRKGRWAKPHRFLLRADGTVQREW